MGNHIPRREFLKATVVTAGGATFLGTGLGGVIAGCADEDAGEKVEPGEAYFPQSVVSGDPKPDSVILWTRVRDDGEAADIKLRLQVARDESFKQRIALEGGAEVVAEVAFDGCVKVRVTGLASATTYYYRFIYDHADGKAYATRVGRTKTAPAADADVPVRFAFVSCQDFNGRYFHAYRRMIEEELDFIVHLGDYVYETTGDPQYQVTSPDRVVAFRDTAGAITFNPGTEDEYQAARSLSNYRDLYRIYRSDADLQRIHEMFPMIAIWDDHEFSDDSHGATATYYDGREDETDVQRRKDANKAWFEYMPVDYLAPDFRYDEAAAFPGDIKIWRDLSFGRHLQLVMTDLRSFRSDHLIAEDAYPGAVAIDQDSLMAFKGSLPEAAEPYVADIATYAEGIYLPVLTAEAEAAGYDASKITGAMSVQWINERVEVANEASGDSPIALITSDEWALLPRGLAFHQIGKISLFGPVGARYLTRRANFELLADYLWAETDGASETCMGDEQEAWFIETVRNSDRTWKVWGNEYCVLGRAVDLTSTPLVPAALRYQFNLSAEDFDGMPNRRDLLIDALSAAGNVVVVTGDIHAFFAATPMHRGDATKKIVEFATGAISSAPYKTLLQNTATSDPQLAASGAGALAAVAEQFLMDPDSRPNPHLGYLSLNQNGYAIVELDGEKLDVIFHAMPDEAVTTPPAEVGELSSLFTATRFRVMSGSADLLLEVGGSFLRWDPEALDWV